MEDRGLLFIPDISGFTRFVTDTEISHSRLIIQELLEILINSNTMGLQISEIEGDAILFYRFGDKPDMKELYRQVEKMFQDFHRYLIAYEAHRFCQCKACRAAIELTLKVVTHYGEFTQYHVKEFRKLLGKDVIVAHQLLKNDIEQHEYWLVTDNAFDRTELRDAVSLLEWKSSEKRTESGGIGFQYALLGPLKPDRSAESFPVMDMERKGKELRLTRDYDVHIITLFHATGDFRYRKQWEVGVTAVEELNHYLPRTGMKCRKIFDDRSEVVFISAFSFHPGRIQFSEINEARTEMICFTLETRTPARTSLTLEFYIRDGFLRRLLFRWFKKKKAVEKWERSLQNLQQVLQDIHVAVEY